MTLRACHQVCGASNATARDQTTVHGGVAAPHQLPVAQRGPRARGHDRLPVHGEAWREPGRPGRAGSARGRAPGCARGRRSRQPGCSSRGARQRGTADSPGGAPSASYPPQVAPTSSMAARNVNTVARQKSAARKGDLSASHRCWAKATTSPIGAPESTAIATHRLAIVFFPMRPGTAPRPAVVPPPTPRVDRSRAERADTAPGQERYRDQPSNPGLSAGSSRSVLASSSMFTSLNVTTLTFLTKRAGRYMSHTHASDMVTSK